MVVPRQRHERDRLQLVGDRTAVARVLPAVQRLAIERDRLVDRPVETKGMSQVAARDEDEAVVTDLRIAVDCHREPAPRIREAPAESVHAPAADGGEGDRLGVAGPLCGHRCRGEASYRGFMVAALDFPLRQPGLDERDD